MFEAFFYFLNFSIMKQVVVWFFIVLPFYSISQDSKDEVDARYLEDQFYTGITYNFELNRPDAVNQRSFSYGLQAGFIKDMPVNANRSLAVGLGLGLGINSYYSNLEASEGVSGIEYAINTESFKRSKIETHLVEVPLEFRFRDSNAEEYKFWRLYTGVKFGYVLNARSKFISEEFESSFNNTDVRKFQYGITLNLGYNTFNIHAYYSLTSLLNDGTIVNGETIDIKPLHIGLIFYIL